MLETRDITVRTKKAVRKWAGLEPGTPLVLDDILEKLRPGSLRQLRPELNKEFEGETCFPIGINDWIGIEGTLKTVRDVRDAVKKRLEGKC